MSTSGQTYKDLAIPQLIWCDESLSIDPDRRRELESAYRQTLYCVPELDLCLEIDKPNEKLLLLAERMEFQTWAFITACNPRSDALSESENNTRMLELEAHLADQGFTYYHAVGTSTNGEWSEPSFFVLGMDASTAVSIGNRWEQMAVVRGAEGQAEGHRT
jgi:hypothetical protein